MLVTRKKKLKKFAEVLQLSDVQVSFVLLQTMLMIAFGLVSTTPLTLPPINLLHPSRTCGRNKFEKAAPNPTRFFFKIKN